MIINPYIFGAPDPAANEYGYLYNWYAASDANFAPTDWKVPTATEFQTLSDYLSGDLVSGGHLKEAGLTHWNTPNTGADNSSGFTALGSGYRNAVDGVFYDIKNYSFIWCSNIYDTTGTQYFYLDYSSASGSVQITYDLTMGFSSRLLYTGAGTPATVTDYDGNVYDTVVIGTQRFTVQNFKCLHYNNGTEIPIVENGTTWAGLTSGAACAYNNDYSLV